MKKPLALAPFLLLVLLGTGCKPPVSTPQPATPTGFRYEERTHEASDAPDEAARCSFKWVWPSATGTAAAIGINKAIEQAVDLHDEKTGRSTAVESVADDFIETCKMDLAEIAAADVGDTSYMNYVSEREYEVKWDQHPITSLLVHSYEYTGGAHGLPWMTAVNVDRETGKSLLLGDLVKTESLRPFMKRVKEAFLFEHEEAMFPESAQEFRNFLDDKDNATDNVLASEGEFYLTSEGFVFYTNVYDISPYVAGPLRVHLPYSDVKTFLKDGSPLMKLIK